MSVTAVTSVLFGDELVLNEDTNCDDVIIRYGSCLGLASQAIDRIHAYVTWLRSKGYRIHNEDELERVKALLKSGFPNSDLRNLDNYARTFRALLSIEELPNKFNVTNSIQVASYEVSEEVDGRFVGTDDNGKPASYWLAGVVTNKRAATAQLPYEVFWLGYPPRKSGNNRDPTGFRVTIPPHRLLLLLSAPPLSPRPIGRCSFFRRRPCRPALSAAALSVGAAPAAPLHRPLLFLSAPLVPLHRPLLFLLNNWLRSNFKSVKVAHVFEFLRLLRLLPSEYAISIYYAVVKRLMPVSKRFFKIIYRFVIAYLPEHKRLINKVYNRYHKKNGKSKKGPNDKRGHKPTLKAPTIAKITDIVDATGRFSNEYRAYARDHEGFMCDVNSPRDRVMLYIYWQFWLL